MSAPMYKQTYTYHGVIDIPVLGGYIFNHGTESAVNDRAAAHKSTCELCSLTYTIIEEKADRLYGTDVISPSYDKEFNIRTIARLNDTVLKKSANKAMMLKDWLDTINHTNSIEHGIYEAIKKAKLSETECCYIPSCVSFIQLKEAYTFVEDHWYHTTPKLRVSAKAYKDKTEREKKGAAKPIPKAFHKSILNAIRQGKKYIDLLGYKFARVQGIELAYTLYTQRDFSNLEKIRVIIVADDKIKHQETYDIIKNNKRFEIVEYDNDADVAEEYKNMEIKPDLDIMNPPYEGNLHLVILETVLANKKSHSTVVSVQPVRWLEDPLAEYKQGSDYKKYKTSIVDKISNLKIINYVDANDKFKIGLNGVDLAIYTFDDRKLSAIKIYSDLAEQTISKILSYSLRHNIKNASNIKEKRILNANKYYVRVNEMIPFATTGGTRRDNISTMKTPWTTLVTNIVYTTSTTADTLRHTIECDTYTDADNQVKSFNTNFIYNLMQLIKLDQHSPLSYIPYMEDYSHVWTDEDYCKFFGLTREESEFMCRAQDDYRFKDFINYINLDEE